MARFSYRKADIRALTQDIISGLEGNADFPEPLVAPNDLQSLLGSFIALEGPQVA